MYFVYLERKLEPYNWKFQANYERKSEIIYMQKNQSFRLCYSLQGLQVFSQSSLHLKLFPFLVTPLHLNSLHEEPSKYHLVCLAPKKELPSFRGAEQSTRETKWQWATWSNPDMRVISRKHRRVTIYTATHRRDHTEVVCFADSPGVVVVENGPIWIPWILSSLEQILV